MEEELRICRDLAGGRLVELKSKSEALTNLQASVQILQEQLRAVPPEVRGNAEAWNNLLRERHHLIEELNDRAKGCEALERQLEDANLKCSHMISSLEGELVQKRLSVRDFAESLEKEVNRLRKERDHMRELYETINLQAASQARQILQLQDHTAQAQVHIAPSIGSFRFFMLGA